MSHRDASYAIWVVPSEEQLPARVQPLREINGDKLFVVYDPEQGRRGSSSPTCWPALAC